MAVHFDRIATHKPIQRNIRNCTMSKAKKVAFETLPVNALFVFERVTYRKSSDFAAFAVNRRNSDPDNFEGCMVTVKEVPTVLAD